MTRRIAAPVEAVWDALADIGTIADWNPGVMTSRLTGEAPGGLGATRYCDLGKAGHLHEEVVVWKPGHKLTMRIIDTNLPFETADIEFALHAAADGTFVTVSPVYTLRFGPLGRVLDRLFVRRSYERGMHALLDGLKQHVEQGVAA